MPGIKTDIVVKKIPEGMSGTGRIHKRKNYGKKRIGRDPTKKVIRKSGGPVVKKEKGGDLMKKALSSPLMKDLIKKLTSKKGTRPKKSGGPVVSRKLSGPTTPSKKKKKKKPIQVASADQSNKAKDVPIIKLPPGPMDPSLSATFRPGKIKGGRKGSKPPRLRKKGGTIGRKHSGTLLVASTYTGIPTK